MGFAWSDNSCAYDSTLTVLYSIWSSHHPRDYVFSGMTSNVASNLKQMFQNITVDQDFEIHRDVFRHAIETFDSVNHMFGEIASVGSILHHLLLTEHETTRFYNRCSNNHAEMVHSTFSGHFQPGMEVHGSIQQWIDQTSSSTRRRCRVCNDPYVQITEYIDLPLIIAFELKDKSTELNSFVSLKQHTGTAIRYRLAGVVYFGDLHFVARVIREDGQVWYHDGITTQHNLIYEGSISSGQIDLSFAHSKDAHTGIYFRM